MPDSSHWGRSQEIVEGKKLLNLTRHGIVVIVFVAVGFLLNDLFHLYRLHRVEWIHVTGLIGNSQSLTLSLWLCAWAILPMELSKYVLKLIRCRSFVIVVFALVLVIASQLCGRSVLKLIFDVLLLAVLFVWFNIDVN